MSSNIDCNCLGSRAMAITVGVVFSILWLLLLFPVRNSHQYMMTIIRDPAVVATFLLILTASAMSILMVVGAVKRNASYMAPWLAIHFVMILSGVAFTFSSFVATMYESRYPHFVDIHLRSTGQLSLFLPATGLLVFLWICVYLHHKGLMNAAVQENSTCANESKIHKCPKEAEAANVQHV